MTLSNAIINVIGFNLWCTVCGAINFFLDECIKKEELFSVSFVYLVFMTSLYHKDVTIECWLIYLNTIKKFWKLNFKRVIQKLQIILVNQKNKILLKFK